MKQKCAKPRARLLNISLLVTVFALALIDVFDELLLSHEIHMSSQADDHLLSVHYSMVVVALIDQSLS